MNAILDIPVGPGLSATDATGPATIAGWTLLPSQNRLVRGGQAILLEPKVMDLLVRLVGADGRTVSREELLHSVWPGLFIADDSLYRAISQLRRAFADHPELRSAIVTVARRGYRLNPAVNSDTPVRAAPPPPSHERRHRFRGKMRWAALGLALLILTSDRLASDRASRLIEASSDGSRVARAEELYARYRHQDNENAILLFEQAARDAPRSGRAAAGLANALAQRFLWTRDPAALDRAVQAGRRAVALEPGSAEAHKALGLALEFSRDMDGALASYRAALGREPAHWGALVNIGGIHHARGQFERARHWYLRAWRTGRQPVSTALKMGRAELDLGRYRQAGAWFRYVLGAEPLHPQARAGLARTHLYSGDLGAALSECALVLQRLPNEPHCGTAQAEALIAAGRWEPAAEILATVVETAPRKWSTYLRFRALQTGFMLDRADERALREFVSDAGRGADQGDPALRHWSVGAALAMLGEPERARRHLARARALGWHNWNWDRLEPAFATLDPMRFEPSLTVWPRLRISARTREIS